MTLTKSLTLTAVAIGIYGVVVSTDVNSLKLKISSRRAVFGRGGATRIGIAPHMPSVPEADTAAPDTSSTAPQAQSSAPASASAVVAARAGRGFMKLARSVALNPLTRAVGREIARGQQVAPFVPGVAGAAAVAGSEAVATATDESVAANEQVGASSSSTLEDDTPPSTQSSTDAQPQALNPTIPSSDTDTYHFLNGECPVCMEDGKPLEVVFIPVSRDWKDTVIGKYIAGGCCANSRVCIGCANSFLRGDVASWCEEAVVEASNGRVMPGLVPRGQGPCPCCNTQTKLGRVDPARLEQALARAATTMQRHHRRMERSAEMLAEEKFNKRQIGAGLQNISSWARSNWKTEELRRIEKATTTRDGMLAHLDEEIAKIKSVNLLPRFKSARRATELLDILDVLEREVFRLAVKREADRLDLPMSDLLWSDAHMEKNKQDVINAISEKWAKRKETASTRCDMKLSLATEYFSLFKEMLFAPGAFRFPSA